MSKALANITAAKRALAKASTLDEVLDIRDKAEAVRVYVKAAAESLEAQNAAADIKLRAERKAGEMLAEMDKIGHRPEKGNTMLPFSSQLTDLGITKMQSSRWQLEAKLPDEEYLSIVAKCNDSQSELTQSAVLRAARIHAFGANDKEENDDTTEAPNLADLISEAREVIARLVEKFGQEHAVTLKSILKDEIEAMEAQENGCH